MDDDGRREIAGRDYRIEVLRLFNRARIAIEHEAPRAVRLADTRRENPVDERVGNQAAGCDDRFGFQNYQGSFRGDSLRSMSPVEMDGILQFQPVDDQASLRAFAAARRSEEKNDQG